MENFRWKISKRDLISNPFFRSLCKNYTSRMHHYREKQTFANCLFYSKCENLQTIFENIYNFFLNIKKMLCT